MIFSASIPPSNAAAALKSLEIMQAEPERRERLWKICNRMHRELRSLGFNISVTETPIVPLVIGEKEKTLKFWRMLLDHGVFTNAIIAPAVPAGREMLRTSYTATLSDDNLDRVLDILEKVGRATDVLS